MTIERYKKINFLILELVIWIILAYMVGFRVINLIVNGYLGEIFKHSYSYLELLLVGLLILFPFLFKLIYSEFPFQYFRNQRLKNLLEKNSTATNVSINDNKQEKIIIVDDNIGSNTISTNNEIEILREYLKQSQKLSERIFSRSSAYLLIGSLIAFAGVGFFYFQSIYTHLDPKLSSNELTFTFRETLPRLGVLIFVEAIAFFFLRQFKSTMEEFRYYESIKRQRENQFLIANSGNIHKDNLEYLKNIIGLLNLSENPNKLAKGETTQTLENQKLSGPESDVVDKFIELLKIVKK